MTSSSSRWGASSSKSSQNWGDVDGDDDGVAPLGSPAPKAAVQPVLSSSVDPKTGVKTVVEFGTNASGEKIRITRKLKPVMKQVRVNRHVQERSNWAKFGDCAGLPKGPEQNITYMSFEIIHLDLRPKKKEEEKEESSLDKLSGTSSIVVCRNCGETGHWTLKCPKRQAINAFAPKFPGDTASEALDPGMGSSSGAAGGGSKYVPMHLRLGAESKGASSGMRAEDAYTLRVTNLSEDVTEADLQDLFRRFGHTQRIYLARDRQTQESRGFAFVNYTNRQDGEAAIAKLNGHGYANLILHVEWAKPREERERPAE